MRQPHSGDFGVVRGPLVFLQNAFGQMKPVEIPFGFPREKVLRKRIVQNKISCGQLLVSVFEKDFAVSADREEDARAVDEIFAPGDPLCLLPFKAGPDDQFFPEIGRLCVLRFHGN